MNRVAVVGGYRTPFAKAFGALNKYSFLELTKPLVQKLASEHDFSKLDEVIFSTVLLDPRTPNAARELVLQTDIPNSTPAHFISNNCISGLVAVNMGVEGIMSGRINSVLAGGSESMSKPTLTFKHSAEKFFMALNKARSIGDKLKLLSTFKPSMVLPVPPSPKEPSTGLTMGQHCELMAKEFKVDRGVQDKIAYLSHLNASKAEESGLLAEEIVALPELDRDNIVRGTTTVEKLSKLKPVFDRTEAGTLTAGNSSALTDGASLIYLMSESEAKNKGLEILGYIDSTVFTALDPSAGLLMAPALALPKLFEKNNLSVSDIDFFEIHEAFAAQVLANMMVWEKGWDRFPELKPIGEIPADKINVNGGSLAIGHPFAATGGRLILSALNQLKRTGKQKAVISVCAAGGMAGAVLVSR